MELHGNPLGGRRADPPPYPAVLQEAPSPASVELRGGRTARLLAAAGIVGVLGSIGGTLFISGHPFDHHPPWYVAVFSAVWAGLLVVSFAIAFLQVRTPSLPLARSALAGIRARALLPAPRAS